MADNQSDGEVADQEIVRRMTMLSGSPATSIKAGELTKQSAGLIKNWRKRWFILTSDLLAYLDRENGEVKGGILLENATKVREASAAESGKRQSCFVVTTADRDFVISAVSDDVRAGWISAISNATSAIKDGSGPQLQQQQTDPDVIRGMGLRFGWVGLGTMGSQHVANMLQAGFHVTVWNRSRAPCERAAALGATVAPSARDVVAESDVTFVMLPTPEVARAVYKADDGVLAGVREGAGVVDCASLDAPTMRELDGLVHARGGAFCAAPVAGHGGMARDATVQFAVAGDTALYARIMAPLDAMGKNRVWLGDDVGAAADMKLVVNGLLASVTASMAEAMAAARGAGLEQRDLMNLVGGHAMNSPLLQLCAKMMMSSQHPPLFQLRLMEKDARLACELHARIGRGKPVVTSAAHQAYATAAEDGFGDSNWTAVYESMKDK